MEWLAEGDDNMQVFKDPESKDKIPDAELVQLGINLKKFVENYRKYVLINVPNKRGNNPFEILKTLDEISHKMITHQYQDLFDDISIVDTTNDSVPF